MNIHVPQSIQTRYELEHLTIVTKQILSPANSSPLIAIFQDSLVAGYLLTQPNVKISERHLFNIMSFSKRFTPDLLPKPVDVIDGENYYSGHQMFSLILPELSYDKAGAVIRNGILTKGVLGKSALSSSSDSLVHNIYNMFGSKSCHQFLDNSQKMLTHWMMGNAFSIGLGDMMPTKALTSVTDFLIKKFLQKANDLVESAHQGVFEPNLTMKYRAQSFEDNIQGIFSQLSNMFEKASDRFLDSNRNQLYTAVKSGSKGVSSNITQIMCSLGQKTLWGYRVPKSFTSRSLPHYHKHDIGAAAGGFVRNSYIKGITPAEFFFDAMGGRTGMIDTAINSVTADTPIVLMENGVMKYVTIGDWIDTHLKIKHDEIEFYEEKANMELLNLTNSVYIPTTNEKGEMSWGEVTAVTRHDPGKQLYKIVTQGGRDVIVAESKSLLIWDEEKEGFYMKHTPLVSVGEFVPVSTNLPLPPTMSEKRSFEEGVKYGKEGDIPDFAFNSSLEFVKGVLYGLLLEHAVISGNKIIIQGCDTETMNKVSMLSSMLDVYVIFDENDIVFEGEWADKLENALDTISSYNKEDLGASDIETFNDVVLDKIIEITPVSVDEYPKLYDLTVPSTLNFGLANGLQVVDTANSGYIQRRLVKAMEDLKVCYNGNVRNAANNIVQFVYGDDGFDTMRLEKQKLNIVADDNITFDKNYKIDTDDVKQLLVYMTDDAVKRFKADKDHAEKVQQEYLQLRRWREELRENYMADMDVMDTTIFSPVNYFRMIPAAVYKFRGDDVERSDLTPLDIIKKTDELLDYITNFYRDKENALLYVKILTKSMLSSKQALFVHKINSTILEYLIHNVKNKIVNSFIKPGEMVGTLAAQSIGEPSTQLTLNSVDWEEPIIVMVDGVTKSVKFGEFVDTEIRDGDGEEEYHKNETTLKWTKHKEYKVMAVDEDGIVRWRQIEAVTKHLPVNEDGSNTLIKVTTRSGRTATATKAKSFLTRVDNKIVPTKGADLRVGDRLPVSYHFPMEGVKMVKEVEGVKLNDEFAKAFSGFYLWSAKHMFELKNESKYKSNSWFTSSPTPPKLWSVNGKIFTDKFKDYDLFEKLDCEQFPDWAFVAPLDFVFTVIKKFAEYPEAEKYFKEDLDIMYARVQKFRGNDDDVIPGVKTDNFEGEYEREYLKKSISLVTSNEAEVLQKAVDQHVFYDPIVSIEEIEPTHTYVYDFTVEQDRTFLNRDLLCLMDTFHLAGVAGKSVVTTSGVARLTEIINLAKTIKTPSMTIRLKDEYKYSEEKAEQLKESLEYTSIKDIINESQILYEHDDLSVSHNEDMEFIRTYFEFSTLMGLEDMTSTYSKWVLRLMFDRESMLNRNIYMQDIQDAIMNTCDSHGEIQAIFSDDNSGDLVMRISIRHEDGESYLDFLKELEQCIMKITLRGIQGIERVGRLEANQVVYHDDGSHEVKKEWIVDTMGTNLKEVFGHEIVDPYHTITNDFYEIERIFGIEGVRYALMKDLNELVGVGSSYNVNYRHIELLVDTMTYRGIMMPIGRHGINRSADNGPLAKASFEEMTEIFVKAGTYAERDNMQGVSGNIIMGQYAPIGTNAFDVYLDEEMIAEHAPDVDEEDDLDVDAYELEQEIDDMYNDEQTREEDVTDEMFDFGFDFDFNNQYQLGSSQLAPPVLNVDGKIEKIETVEVENTDSDDESIDVSSDEEEVEIDVSETDEAGDEEEIDVTDDEEEEELHDDAERLEDTKEEIDVSEDEEMGDDQEVEAEDIYEEDTDAEKEEEEEEIDVSDED